ncbi:hypothetical protein HDU87_005930 [Geranomyces variabilis]|uniref:ASX DEUBAD domain-containing protein n=1 Tax=Geranomyces variabilis TaxID=109894 RepID=A0AAD5TQS3_9FUNG|nr:hypothetical protein HDU87_005930 [Geranomyces variabilis]
MLGDEFGPPAPRAAMLIQLPGKNLFKKCFTPGVLDVFSLEEQAELASLLPSVDQTGAGMISPAVFNSVHIRETLAKFQEDLEEGLYDPGTLEAMVEDVEMQKDKYEAWKDRHYEETWGERLDAGP